MAKQQGKLTVAQKAKEASDAKQVIARNKKARHDYLIEDTYEGRVCPSLVPRLRRCVWGVRP